MIYGAIALEPTDWWKVTGEKSGVPNMQAAFSKIFGQGLLIIVGSIAAFLLAQLVDVTVFQQIKKATGESKVWLRATGSTLVSQLIDSFVVTGIAFYFGPRIIGSADGGWTFAQYIAISTNGYIYKFLMAILLTPVIYAAHHFIDKYLGDELAVKMKAEAAL